MWRNWIWTVCGMHTIIMCDITIITYVLSCKINWQFGALHKKQKSKYHRTFGFSCCSQTYLVLTRNGDLLHWVQNVVEHLVRVFSVDLVGTLDAEVEWRGAVGGECDWDNMIVANFGCFRITSVRTQISLARKWLSICQYHLRIVTKQVTQTLTFKLSEF